MDKKPEVSKELIDYLDELYPNKTPDLWETMDEIRTKSGQRSVVDHLISIFEELSESVFNS